MSIWDSSKNTGYLTLRIDANSGVETVPDMNINITNVSKDGGVTRQKHFFDNGYGGITFKVLVHIKHTTQNKEPVPAKTDMWNGTPVKDVLHNWFINKTPLHIVTDAIDVPNETYIITKNPTRKQTKKGLTAWDLEFTTYTPLNLFKYKNDNTAVLAAINKAKKANANAKKKTKSANQSKLSKCKYTTLVYSSKQKTVTCVKYMQEILYKQKLLTKKQVDGWFGPKTKTAVKKFQQNYNKTHKITINVKNGQKMPTGKKLLSTSLSVTGKVDKATFKALCEA